MTENPDDHEEIADYIDALIEAHADKIHTYRVVIGGLLLGIIVGAIMVWWKTT